MSLRFKLFFLFSSLIVVLLAAQWWMWGRLTQDLDRELGSMAFSVGTSMVETLSKPHWISANGDVETFDKEHLEFLHQKNLSPEDIKAIQEDLEIDFDEDDAEHDIEVITNGADDIVHKIERGKKRVLIFGGEDQDFEVHRELKHDTEATYTFVTRQDSGKQVQTRVIMRRNKDEEKTDELVEDRVISFDNYGDLENLDEADLKNITIDIDTENMSKMIREAMEAKEASLAQFEERLDSQMEAVSDALVEAHTLRIALDDPLKARYLVVQGEEDVRREIPIHTSGIAASLDDVRQRFLWGSLLILALGLGSTAALAHRFTTPLRQLASAASEVGEGHFGHRVETTATGEVGVAIASFNTMSQQLQELEARNHAMQQRAYLSELGEVANGLAHTLRNPLNTLGLSVEQMASLNPGNEQGMELAQLARQQIRRIDQWVRSFLALASQGVSHTTNLDFIRIIQDVVLEAIQDGARDVDLDMDLPDELPQVPGVAPEMRAVLQSLVVNAVEASPEGGTVRICIEQGSSLRILVEDEGPGVDPSIREKLFSPHVTTKETGSGMGLFLANRIIASRYGGTVRLDDRDGGGTVAIVSIPLEDV